MNSLQVGFSFCWFFALSSLAIGAERAWPIAVASQWPEADQLFHVDPRWRGGDGASSVDLGEGRVLWLFGDSFVSNKQVASRKETRMVNNTVAIQQGYDPASAKMSFYWNSREGRAESFFASENDHWYWPAGGVMIDDQLLIFLMRIRRAEKMLGFAFVESAALLIRNPQDSPDQWHQQSVKMPKLPFKLIYGSGGFVTDQRFLYSMSPVNDQWHPAYLVRWPLDEARRGSLKNATFYDGELWQSPESLAELSTPTLPNAQAEFSIHRMPELNAYVQVQCAPFLEAEVQVRHAPQLPGPWSAPRAVFDPKLAPHQPPGIFYYAAKAHPELVLPGTVDAGFVVTYCSNARQLGTVVEDESIYYPRFLKVTLQADQSKE